MKIAAAIVTYEPDLARLSENLSAIVDQVESVFVFDNGSENAAELRALLARWPAAQLLANDENIGIAAALNALCRLARPEHDAVLTLDQDSVSPPGMVEILSDIAGTHPRVAMVTPFIVDRNKMTLAEYGQLDLPQTTMYTQAARKGAITSGALLSLDAWESIRGFDEVFFIDYVDYDLNQRLLLDGWLILRANRTALLHEVGRASPTWLVTPRKDLDGSWKLERFFSFGHGAQRCYFKARNRILFTRKYGRRIGLTHEGAWQLPQQIALTLLFEKDRLAKARAFCRGIRDGVRLQLDKSLQLRP